MRTHKPAICIASKYQPKALKYILDSKDISDYSKYNILSYEMEKMNCAEIGFRFQPLSLLHILKSDYCKSSIIDKADDSGYTIYSKLKNEYRDLENEEFKNIDNKLPIMKHENIVADNEDDPMLCPICYEFKKRVVFLPCSHQTCVSCSIRTKSCAMCRTEITKRKILY
jgi:hypothetical protein